MLAWFSSATHLATLLFLQEYLQKNMSGRFGQRIDQ
jgi:hypothetical protein